MRIKEVFKINKNKSRKIIETIKKKVFSKEFMLRSKYNKKDFTRNRKLPFSSLILFMLNLVKDTLQKELTNYMILLSSSDVSPKKISKSAFSQSRSKLKPDAFVEMNNTLVHEFYADDDFLTWEGFRLLSIDGSTCQLPYSDDLSNYFGQVEGNSGKTFPIARISTFYDLLNEIIIDSRIAPYKTAELDLALKHLDKLKKNDLVILDRGYPAIWLFYLLMLKGTNYVVRLQKNFIKEANEFWDSKEESKILEIKNCPSKSQERLNKLGISFNSFKLRLVKVILDNGEMEILATSLLDEEKYYTSIFKNLYFRRWGIETNYDHLKNQIEIENFTGLTKIAIEQDFFANMFIANLQSIIIKDAKEELEKENKNCKYEYKINRNLSLSYMKDRVIKLFTSNDPHYYDKLVQLFKIEPIPIRNGRKFNRKSSTRKKKYFINKGRAF